MSLWIAFSCFFARSSLGTSLNLLGTIGRSAKRHFLSFGSYCVGLGEADEVPDRPRDHVVVADEVRLVLGLLEGAGQRGREVAADGGLLGDDEGLRHGNHLSEGGKRQELAGT